MRPTLIELLTPCPHAWVDDGDGGIPIVVAPACEEADCVSAFCRMKAAEKEAGTAYEH